MTPFTFALLALAAFRIQRIWTTDKWPPSQWFRDKVKNWGLRNSEIRGGKVIRGKWRLDVHELLTCAWCSGFWTSIAVFSEHHFLAVIPIWLYAVLAASTIVGMLGNYDD